MGHFLHDFAADIPLFPGRDDLLSKTELTSPVSDSRWTGYLLVAFLCVGGAASVVWIGAIGWFSWRLINWFCSC